MSAFLKLLGASFGGSWIVYAVIAAAVFAAGGVAGEKARGLIDAPIIAQANTDTANAVKDGVIISGRFSNYIAQVERDRADANARALAQQAALSGEVASLQAELRVKEAARQNVSNALLKALQNAPMVDTSPLGPAARRYYDSVRQQQRSAADSTPGRSPN
jgi:hypothetical protein